MLRGLSTVSFYAADHEEAKRWYTELLGTEPYFDRPGYFEFRLGDFEAELGIIDARYAPAGSQRPPGGGIVYWHVDDVDSVLARLIELGATVWEPLRIRGDGYVTASVVDPFGNILGVMQNPHYLEVVAKVGAAGSAGGSPDPD
jgi:predicted enzyme related to lactoylglutathione lyase